MSKPKNHYEALVLALRLAVTASGDDRDEKERQCLDIADWLAMGLLDYEIEGAREEAGVENILFYDRYKKSNWHVIELEEEK